MNSKYIVLILIVQTASTVLPPDPPTNIKALLITYGVVEVSWTLSPETNGPLDLYKVMLTQNDYWLCYTDIQPMNSCKIYDVMPNLTMTIHVFGCMEPTNFDGNELCSRPSKPITFTTWTEIVGDFMVEGFEKKMGSLVQKEDFYNTLYVHIPFHQINLKETGPLQNASLLIQPVDHFGEHESPKTVFYENMADDPYSNSSVIFGTYKNRADDNSWEVILPVNYSAFINKNIPSMDFLVGSNAGLPKTSNKYNGHLSPDTKYKIRLILYSTRGYTATAPIHLETKKLPDVILYVSLLLLSYVIAVVSIYATIRCIDRRQENNWILVDENKKFRFLDEDKSIDIPSASSTKIR